MGRKHFSTIILIIIIIITIIVDNHRGILPSNIIVAALVSNQGIWSVSRGDWEER